MKRAFLMLSCAILALLTGGCISSRSYRLPAIKADEIVVTHTDWAGSITARAKGLHVTESYYVWEEASWSLQYGGWHDSVTATNFRQKREKEDEK